MLKYLSIRSCAISLTIFVLMSVNGTNHYVHWANCQRSLLCSLFTGVRVSFRNLVGLCRPCVATPTVPRGRYCMLELQHSLGCSGGLASSPVADRHVHSD